MADLSVPGVNGQYDKLIEAIMKAERLPREKEATSLEKLKGQLSNWQGLNRFGSQVRDVARSFYSFNNPFSEHIATSSNEAAFTAVAARDAKEESAKISIKQIASADSFLSDEVPKEFKVDAGHYVFYVGERKLEFDWKGGNYKSFLQAINRRGKDFLLATEIKVTPKTTAMLFTSSLVGEKNKLRFEDDALLLAEKIGVLKKGEAAKSLVEKAYIEIPPFSSSELSLSLLEKTENADFLEITFSIVDSESSKAESAVSTEKVEGAKAEKEKMEILSQVRDKESGLEHTRTDKEIVGSVSYEGIVLKNNPSDAKLLGSGEALPLEEKDENVAEDDEKVKTEDSVEDVKADNAEKVDEGADVEKKDDVDIEDASKNSVEGTGKEKKRELGVFYIKSANGKMEKLQDIQDIKGEQVLRFKLDGKEDFHSLLLNNKNSFAISIDSIKILTKSFESDYIPAHPVSIAKDAIISYQGIEMRRDSNSISDIIPSITLNIHKPTDQEETLTVKPNTELLKNSIIEFIGKYNRLIAELNILTNNKNEIIEELGYFTDEEKEAALKRLGSFYGDATLSSLKTNLQYRMMDSYGTDEERSIKLLAQLGISTNASASSSVDASRLRGYLEIDEKVLEQVLSDNIEGVKSFFGFDSDGDIIVDSGLAYSIYEYLNPYTQRGGIFFTRMTGVEDKIKASEKRIVAYDKKLAQKEAELKRKYGAMEGTLKDLKKQSDVISNFNKSQEK